MATSETIDHPAATNAGDTAAAVIQLQELRHQYGERTALAGVSFDVRAAEIFGLLGPNGSGKTTTFRILSTLMVPTGGRALIMGHDVAREPGAVRRSIGVVFQEKSIDIKLSAEENLMLVGHVYGWSGLVSPIAPKKKPRSFPEGCSGGWNLPRDCCTIRRCCCSTSPPPDSIRVRAAICGSTCTFCVTKNA
jgi:hypothetical protein